MIGGAASDNFLLLHHIYWCFFHLIKVKKILFKCIYLAAKAKFDPKLQHGTSLQMFFVVDEAKLV